MPPSPSRVAAGLAFTALAACGRSGPDPDSVANLQIVADEWEIVAPGTPPAPDPAVGLRVNRVIEPGTGWTVSAGDLVELRLRTSRGTNGSPDRDVDATGWVWTGFGRDATYDFGTPLNDAFKALLLDRARGAVFTVTKNFTPYASEVVGQADGMPFGARDAIAARAARGPGKDEFAALLRGAAVYADGRPGGGPTSVEIVRVCRGQASTQLTTLVAPWPVRTAQDFNGYTETAPRYHYVRRARWAGGCDDGRGAAYETGPIRVLTPNGRPQDRWNLDRAPWKWVTAAWDGVAAGVRRSP